MHILHDVPIEPEGSASRTTAGSIGAQALEELGVRDDTLSDEEKERLRGDGYLDLGLLVADEHLERMRERIEQLLVEEGREAGAEVHQEDGTDRLADLINKDPIFDVCFTHPRFLAAVREMVDGEIRLSSLNMRAPREGAGHQGFHVDFFRPVPDGDFQVCNSVWMVDDFTEDNGPTRIVPGSHWRSVRPADELDGDPTREHPEEVLVTGRAGTVVVFSSHLWHGGTVNCSGGARRGVFSYFQRRDDPKLGQQLDQQRHLRAETYARLSPAARYLLDVTEPT